MNQEELGSSSNFLSIKELKEKVRTLIADVDLNHENCKLKLHSKFKHEKRFDNDSEDLSPIEDFKDEFIDCSEFELLDETNWLTNENHSQASVIDICKIVYSDIDDNRPDISNLCRQLESSFVTESNISSSSKPFIDSRTFTRPKKYSVRSPLPSVVNSKEEGRPKLQRRLTTTITPTPNLISKLEELSKSNNRPVSGNYDTTFEDNSREGVAETNTPVSKIKASLYDRLQELKKSNSNYKISVIVEPNTPEKAIQNEARSCIWEDAKKVKAALDVDMKDSLSSSRLSEIIRNTQDYYSDDNESFINLDEVSGFCDRLTMSVDQTTYSTIVKEMEQNEICLFHRTINDTNPQDKRFTFGGTEIPLGDFANIETPDRSNEKANLLSLTYKMDEEENIEEKANSTFEIKNNISKHNVMNSTYDANKAPGLLDAVLQSDIIKSISPNYGQKNNSSNLNININNNNNNNSNNNNNKMLMVTGNEGNGMNRTFDKFNGTLNQNQLNFLHTEKYSTKVFDSSFRKQEPQLIKAEKRKNSFKKENDYSEDECMSTNSDLSCKSLENNAEGNIMEEPKNVVKKQNKKYFSTPTSENAMKLDLDVFSPIRMEVGDGESQAFSNPSSRGHSPRRIPAPMHQEGMQKQGMPILRQPLKVPQLKLKPPSVRPAQTFKKGLINARTSSEPSVPQKAESWQPVASVPVLRPAGPTVVPSLTNVRPLSRVSGIPRPPTRLKQPQIRAHHTKN